MPFTRSTSLEQHAQGRQSGRAGRRRYDSRPPQAGLCLWMVCSASALVTLNNQRNQAVLGITSRLSVLRTGVGAAGLLAW